MKKLTRLGWGALLALFVSVGLLAQTPFSSIRVKNDANSYLITTMGAYTAPDGPATPFANMRLKVDANNYLITTIAGGSATPDTLCVDAANHDTCLGRGGAAGKLTLTGTTPMFQLGGTTSGSPAIKANGANLEGKLADDSAYTGARFAGLGLAAAIPANGIINVGTAYQLSGVTLISASAPSALSACGGATAPSFAWTNGTASFEIITGGSTPVATCTWTMPASANKWVCDATDITTQSTSVFYMKQTASSTTSVTVTNFNTAGAATAVTASDHLLVKCSGG